MFIHGTPFIRTGTVSKQADTNRFIENEIEQTDDGRFVWSYDVEEGKQVNKALLVQHEFFSDGGSKEEVLGGLPFAKTDSSGLDRLLPALAEEASKLKAEYETFGNIESKAFEAEGGNISTVILSTLAFGGLIFLIAVGQGLR
jgi:hypothetical protein